MVRPSPRGSSEKLKVQMLIFAIIVNVVVFCVLTIYHNQIFDGAGQRDCQVQVLQHSASNICNHTESISFIRSLMKETKTDKDWRHMYYRTYGRIFATLRQDRIRLLEIGVSDGKSVPLWQKLFPNFDHIYGIGYKNYQTERKQDLEGLNTTLYMGDQSDVEFLQYVCQDAGKPFDIIIDDGSHLPEHQMISLEHLMNCLKPGGLYIIEDIETSYWNKPGASLYGYKFNGYGLNSNRTFIELTKRFVDVINRQYHQKLDLSFLDIDHQIASIMFEQNIVVIRKVDEWDAGLHDRKYLCEKVICD